MSKELENQEVVEAQVEETTPVLVDELANAKVKKEAKASLKKLDLGTLKKENKKLDERTTATITVNGTDYQVQYDKVFRKTKQRAVLDDTLNFFQEIGAHKPEHLDMASAYTALLIVKHFTDLEVPDDVNEALALLEVLIDLEVLGAIVNELPEDEVVKIYELLTNAVDSISNNIDQAEKEAEMLEAELENEEVKELVRIESVKEDDE